MRKILSNHLAIVFGWLFVILGAIGVVLPLLPTTPFLILALALFAKSSPKFHQMLLNNKWFGQALQQWEERKTVPPKVKQKATVLIVITFSVSITLLHNKTELQLILLGLAALLLFFIWRLKEEEKLKP